MPRKPAASTIRSATPLSKGLLRPANPITACNVCGVPSDSMHVFLEHDERDQPIPGAYVFLGSVVEHAGCHRVLEEHPRLYEEVLGDAGSFPLLCGPCLHRVGDMCAMSRKAGGVGVTITVDRGPIICSRGRGGGCARPPGVAVKCSGRKVEGGPG